MSGWMAVSEAVKPYYFSPSAHAIKDAVVSPAHWISEVEDIVLDKKKLPSPKTRRISPRPVPVGLTTPAVMPNYDELPGPIKPAVINHAEVHSIEFKGIAIKSIEMTMVNPVRETTSIKSYHAVVVHCGIYQAPLECESG
jgi:hypothetical protein